MNILGMLGLGGSGGLNDTLVKTALGTVKKTMREENLSTLVVKYDREADDISFDFKKEGTVTLPIEEFANYQATYLRMLRLDQAIDINIIDPNKNEYKLQPGEGDAE